jgi:hypothetical protein
MSEKAATESVKAPPARRHRQKRATRADIEALEQKIIELEEERLKAYTAALEATSESGKLLSVINPISERLKEQEGWDVERLESIRHIVVSEPFCTVTADCARFLLRVIDRLIEPTAADLWTHTEIKLQIEEKEDVNDENKSESTGGPEAPPPSAERSDLGPGNP